MPSARSIDNERAFPEAKDAVLFERRHPAQQPFVDEGGAAPLHLLLHVRDGGMDELANVVEDRLGEVGGLRDIGVEGGILVAHGDARVLATGQKRIATCIDARSA